MPGLRETDCPVFVLGSPCPCWVGRQPPACLCRAGGVPQEAKPVLESELGIQASQPGPTCWHLTPSKLWSRPLTCSSCCIPVPGEHRVLNSPLAPTAPSRSWPQNSGLEVGVEGGLASQRNEFLSRFRGQRETWASDGLQDADNHPPRKPGRSGPFSVPSVPTRTQTTA